MTCGPELGSFSFRVIAISHFSFSLSLLIHQLVEIRFTGSRETFRLPARGLAFSDFHYFVKLIKFTNQLNLNHVIILVD